MLKVRRISYLYAPACKFICIFLLPLRRLYFKPTIFVLKMRHIFLTLIFNLIMLPVAFGSNAGELNIIVLGDSNTSIGGDDCLNPKGWTKWFAERLSPKSCRSYARSGATWTNTKSTRYDIFEKTDGLSDNNVIYNQANRLINDCDKNNAVTPDVIIIAAGTNDAWFSAKRPGLYAKTAEQAFLTAGYISKYKPSSVLTLAESVRYVCETLMQRFPKVQIILLTPMQTIKASYQKIRQTGDIIEQCANRMAIPVVRQDFLTGVYDNQERISQIKTSDGTHTSAEGARRNGFLLANIISLLLCY